MRNFFLGGVCAFALMGSVALFAAPSKVGSLQANETYRQLNLFGEIFERVRNDYYKETKDEELMEAAINGMLASLDPYSVYLPPRNFQEARVQTRGEFGGLGIEVTQENGLIKVVSPIDDTPAQRAGILPGDLITHLDGDPVMGKSLQESIEKMRGTPNTPIVLTIRRGVEGSAKTFDVKITRAIIKTRVVRSRREGEFGYLRISSFNEHTTQDLVAAIEKLKAEMGPELKGYIIDLRDNPGGLLDQAISVADTFLNQGEIVSTRSLRSTADEGQRYNAKRGDIAEGKPIAVLINGGSASASEIVAGALQDHHRAVIVGSTTFGKGLVQTMIPLGEFGGMKLTTAGYFTPSGRSIDTVGITPDVEAWNERDHQIAAALKARRELSGTRETDENRPQEQQPNNVTPPSQIPAPGQDGPDLVLQAAIEVLRAPPKPSARK
ncbi:S41 family peptidase [uncultured Ferrovibrio sp.]|jgi:carboxyl-terminal processing protease|uniref:S41 family peptidase n=1 Tax=uncultured Ferrovibrio sp. TaxID=1576913 RepID=UPI00261BFC1C|nr:S41 family peptidase [uncultured Ferrovibrio sp.]